MKLDDAFGCADCRVKGGFRGGVNIGIDSDRPESVDHGRRLGMGDAQRFQFACRGPAALLVALTRRRSHRIDERSSLW